MPSTAEHDQYRLGFLAAVEVAQRGVVGGLLVTNRFGRPLEFQCTTPVRPNRTQEILYGPTLLPFVLTDLIARTLVEKIGIKPHLVLTDRREMLDLRRHIAVPVVAIVDDAEAADENGIVRIGRQRFRVHSDYPEDVEAVRKIAAAIARDADMREPIDRVLVALKETMGAAA